MDKTDKGMQSALQKAAPFLGDRCGALGDIAIMRRNHYSVFTRTYLLFICMWPGFVSGDGGIGSLGAVLPVFVALSVLALAVFIWLVLSANLLVTKPKKITKRKISFYKTYSFIVITMLFVICIVGFSFMGGVAMLLFLVLVVVSVLTAANISRARRLMQAELNSE